MMNPFISIPSWIASRWKISAAIACAVGIAAACRICLETDQAKLERAERKREKALRTLADQISTYGCTVHQRYPTGDVVVSERDLAALFRKHPEAVATALTLLSIERKVQKAPLDGYWKLNL